MAKIHRLKSPKAESNWESALQGFLYWKQAQGLSETTIDDYRRHVRMFFKRFPVTLQGDDLRPSILEYMSDNIKPATYNLRFIYLRAFFQWCINEGYMSANPLRDFKRRKTSDRIVQISEETLQQLLSLPNKSDFAGLRDYALILLTLDTGIRPNEAFSLLKADIDLAHLSVGIKAENAKTRIARTLPILAVTAEAIRKLISSHHPTWDDSVPVFCNFEGGKMSRGNWGYRMQQYSKKLGVKIRPYDLRHSFALLYLRHGGHAFGLQNTLGHTSMQMSRRYVHLTNQDLRDAHTQASPLNAIVPKRSAQVRKIGKKKNDKE